MSNRRRLRAPGRSNSRIRAEVEVAQHLGIAPHRLHESATATLDAPADSSTPEPAPQTVTETIRIVEASAGTVAAAGGRRYKARLIEGDRWGSSGYWPRDLVERDGPKAWPAGTLMYLDHPTSTEEAERPERSVRDLAAQIVTTPAYEGDGLYAMVETFAHAQPLIESLAGKVGLSIRANGTASPGIVGGRSGMVVESVAPSALNSVDFVTVAGAGGKLVSLAEAARVADVQVREARNVEAWFESRIHTDFTVLADNTYGDGRLTREERITLSQAIGDALAAFSARIEADAPQLAQRDIWSEPETADSGDAAMSEAQRLQEATAEETRQALCDAITDAYGTDTSNSYVWVRDYDPDKGLVWYDAPDEGDQQTWQQEYTATGTPLEVTLAATRTEVVARTVYDPAPPDAEDAAEGPMADAPGMQESARQVAETATTTDVTDGAPPTAPNPPEQETGMSGNQNTGPAPGAAGTSDTGALSAAVTEAQTARTAAEQALAESTRLAEAATVRAAAAETELARFRAVEAARPIVTALLSESQVDTSRAQARVMAQVADRVPLTEAGVLDEAALRTAAAAVIAEAEADLAEARQSVGAGRVTGFGSNAAGNAATSTADRQAARERNFRLIGMSEAAAKVAAIGGRI